MTTNTPAAPSLFDLFGEVIYSYTREQAIADGVLVDLTALAAEAGFSCPVAITRAAWAHAIEWTRSEGWQDETGRAVLLALAALSDEALNSPQGYDGIPAAYVARLVGLAPATVVRWLRSLEALNLATNQRGRLWRVPEEAFNR